MGKVKIAELYGGSFYNKGAELMVTACSQELASWSDSWTLAMDWTVGAYTERARRGFVNKVDFKSLKKFSHLPAEFCPQKIKMRLGIVSKSEISHVLDISGFGYSDQWGTEFAKIMYHRANSASSKNESYYLLPQAYGPFTDPKLADMCRGYFDKAKTIYVRDKSSMHHMKKLMGDDERLNLCPDFTCLVQPDENMSPTDKSYACIVPNCRMLDKRHGNLGGKYLSSLIKAVNHISVKGLTPVIVNHEGPDDLKLVRELEKQATASCIVIEGGDAKQLKGIFTKAKFVLGSRYHALISGLSQGVPVIGTGWSHKYEELFSDFNIKELLIDIGQEDSEFIESIDLVLDPNERELIIERIRKSADVYKKETEKMWGNIKSLMQQ